MVALLLVAVSLGLSNLAASIGIGVAGIDARTRLRVGLTFGLFETAMPLIGLLLGRRLAGPLGQAAHWIGAGLLIATGLYALGQAARSRAPTEDGADDGADDGRVAQLPTGRLIATALALSIDNLAVGFALGTYRISVIEAAIVIGSVSAGLSLLGLELGRRIGRRAGEQGEIIGGLILVAVGIVIAAGVS